MAVYVQFQFDFQPNNMSLKLTMVCGEFSAGQMIQFRCIFSILNKNILLIWSLQLRYHFQLQITKNRI